MTKQKFIPYWESRDTFNELTLNLTAIQEHSIGNLSHHLNKIAQEYESGVNEHCHFSGLESAHTSYSPTQGDQEHIVEDEGWFVLCSMPRGLATLIPALLAFLALIPHCCSIRKDNFFSNQSFFRRHPNKRHSRSTII